MILIKANESTAGRRRVFFHLVDATDGMTPETGEAGGQPQVSVNGGAWSDTGIGTLTSIGNGRYYAELTQTVVATAGTIIETRYKSANTAECPGESVQVVAFDPHDAAGLGLSRIDDTISSRSSHSAANAGAAAATAILNNPSNKLATDSDGKVTFNNAIPAPPDLNDIASSVWSASSRSLTDKAGFKLASDGLDSISTAAPTGVASNFREMMVQIWRRWFKKSTMTATELKTYADNGTDVLTTQAVSDDGTTQTQGAAG